MKYGPHELEKLRRDLKDDLAELFKKAKEPSELEDLIDPYQGLDETIGEIMEILEDRGYGK